MSHAQPTTHAPSSDCELRLLPTGRPRIQALRSGRFITPIVSSKTPQQCFRDLRALHSSAFKTHLYADPSVVLEWANHPELWAEYQIRYRGWSFHAAESVVRQCRILRKRAALAIATYEPTGSDPYDPLMPSRPTQQEEQQQEEPEA